MKRKCGCDICASTTNTVIRDVIRKIEYHTDQLDEEHISEIGEEKLQWSTLELKLIYTIVLANIDCIWSEYTSTPKPPGVENHMSFLMRLRTKLNTMMESKDKGKRRKIVTQNFSNKEYEYIRYMMEEKIGSY